MALPNRVLYSVGSANNPLYQKGEPMRTITESLLHRLAVQASEAELQGLTKVAEALTEQIEKHSSNVRATTDFYSYSEEEFKKDVTAQFWGAILRIADYYNIKHFDAAEVNTLIDKMAQDMISDVCASVGIRHGVGAYEEPVPGEEKQQASIEVDED